MNLIYTYGCHNQSELSSCARDQSCLSDHSCLYILDTTLIIGWQGFVHVVAFVSVNAIRYPLVVAQHPLLHKHCPSTTWVPEVDLAAVDVLHGFPGRRQRLPIWWRRRRGRDDRAGGDQTRGGGCGGRCGHSICWIDGRCALTL